MRLTQLLVIGAAGGLGAAACWVSAVAYSDAGIERLGWNELGLAHLSGAGRGSLNPGTRSNVD
jgi:hypothetical protein